MSIQPGLNEDNFSWSNHNKWKMRVTNVQTNANLAAASICGLSDGLTTCIQHVDFWVLVSVFSESDILLSICTELEIDISDKSLLSLDPWSLLGRLFGLESDLLVV